MHRHQALNDFLVVLPLLLVGVVVGVSFDLDRQSTQIHFGPLPLDSLHWNLLTCGRVLDDNYSLVQTRLLLHDDIGGHGAPSELFLRLGKHRCMLLLLGL